MRTSVGGLESLVYRWVDTDEHPKGESLGFWEAVIEESLWEITAMAVTRDDTVSVTKVWGK